MLWITTRDQVQCSSDLVRDFEKVLDLSVLLICLLVFGDKFFENIQIEGELLLCIEFTFSALPSLCLYRLTAKGLKVLMVVSLVIYPRLPAGFDSQYVHLQDLFDILSC